MKIVLEVEDNSVKQQLTLTTFSDCSTNLRTIKTIR